MRWMVIWWDEVEACSTRWCSWMLSVFGVTFLWWAIVEVCSTRWCYWMLLVIEWWGSLNGYLLMAICTSLAYASGMSIILWFDWCPGWETRLIYAGCWWCKYFIVVLMIFCDFLLCLVYFWGWGCCLIVEQGLVNLFLLMLWVVSVQ